MISHGSGRSTTPPFPFWLLHHLLQVHPSCCLPLLVAPALVAMDGDSRFGFGGDPPSFRTIYHFLTIPQHSTLVQPRMAVGGVNPLDLTSAIEHELRRGTTLQPNWAAWNLQQELQLQFSGSFDSLEGDSAYGYLDHAPQQVIPHYIPRFDEALDPAALQPQPRFDALPHHSGTRSANGFLPSHLAHQVLQTGAATVDSL